MKIDGEVQNTDFVLDESVIPTAELLSQIEDLYQENSNLKAQLLELRRFASSVPGSPYGGH